MAVFSKITRLRQIGVVFAKYGLISFLPKQFFSIIGTIQKESDLKEVSNFPIEKKLRFAFEELGTTFIKLGQLLSQHEDIIPPKFAKEFKNLQNNVKPVKFEKIKPLLEEELAGNLLELFDDFDEKPIATASISQVYQAKLKETGEEIVIKIRKPGIIKKIKGDIEIILWLADLLDKHSQFADRIHFREISEEFFLSMNEEINLINEKNNLKKFKENFDTQEWNEVVSFPKVYERYCSESVIVMEKMQGKTLYELDETFLSLNRKSFAKKGAEILIKQILYDGFFHSDLHAGNVLFNEETLKIEIIDCGMIGRLDNFVKERIIDMFIAFASKDYLKLATIYVEISETENLVDKKNLAYDIEKVLESLPNSLGSLDYSILFPELMKILNRHKLKMPRSLTQLIRGITVLEGFGRELDPDFDFIEEANKVSFKLLKMRYTPERLANEGLSLVFRFMDFAKNFPVNLNEIFDKMERGKLKYGFMLMFRKAERKFFSKMITRLSSSFILAAGIVTLGLIGETRRNTIEFYFTVALVIISFFIFFLTFISKGDDEND